MVATEIVPGMVLKLFSGRFVEVESGGSGSRFLCFYVDDLGRPLAPARQHQITLSRQFIENYGRRWRLDSPS